jgi:hypothetical protein
VVTLVVAAGEAAGAAAGAAAMPQKGVVSALVVRRWPRVLVGIAQA